jgi:hypothetical protein
MFDLTAARWESIIEFMQLWRGRRMESRNQSIGLMEEYTSLKKGVEDLGSIDSEANYNEFLDILAFQEKHLVNEESIMKEIQEIFKLREKLIEMAVEAFKI